MCLNNRGSVKGLLLLIIIGAVILLAIFVVRPLVFNKHQRKTSDAAASATTIRIAGDGYLGYWFITSPEMRTQSPRKGLEIAFTDDGGNYAERLEKFDDKEYDCIVLPVNSYLQHGAKEKFQGVIVAAISESKGADAIVGFPDLMPSGKINDLNDPDLRIIYTGQSPSSFLLDLTIADFDLDRLRTEKTWRHEAASSEEVYDIAKKASKDRTKGDAFVMWEPEVSKAIEKLGMKYLWGSDKFAGYIIDVFVFRRDFVAKNPEIVQKFLGTYFRVLDTYAANPERMVKEMKKSADLSEPVIESMIKKIDWYNLAENCSQEFGIQTDPSIPANDGIISTIIACSDVMSRAGYFDNDDLRDPYIIVNSSFLDQLSSTGVKAVGADGKPVVINFKPLNDQAWTDLKEVGTMRIEPITFKSGSNSLDDQGKEVVDKVAKMLVANYPTYRVAIKGHTGAGDVEANKALSLERAQVVLQRLVAVHSVVPERLHAYGLGATQPPKLKPGESQRSLGFRMPRVEFILLEGNEL